MRPANGLTLDEELEILAATPTSALDRLIEAEEMRRDFACFMQWAWPLSHREPLQWNWHLGCIAEHLEACKLGQIRKLLINIPPRHLKSWTVSVAFPAWWWTDDPAIQFLATSADKDVVYRDADAQRDLCASAQYRTMFRPRWDFRASATQKQQDAKGYYRNSEGGHRISKPIGSRGTGQDCDVLLIDDPLDPKDAFNDAAALGDHIIQYRTRFASRLNNPKTGVTVGVMQRLHEMDFSGVMIEEGGWVLICIPSEFDGEVRYSLPGKRYDPRTEEGELAFPERFPAEVLAEKKQELTERGYAGQHQQRPAPAKGAMVLKDWLEHWVTETLPRMDYVIGSWDCSFGSKTRHADFVVGQTWGRSGTHFYLLDQVREKMNVTQMIEAIKAQHRLWPHLRCTLVEERAAGKKVMRRLETEIPGLEGFDPGPRGSKEARLHACVPLFERRQVWLPHPMLALHPMEGGNYSWVTTKYTRELTTFPAASHDDQVDATSQALIWMEEHPTQVGRIAQVG